MEKAVAIPAPTAPRPRKRGSTKNGSKMIFKTPPRETPAAAAAALPSARTRLDRRLFSIVPGPPITTTQSAYLYAVSNTSGVAPQRTRTGSAKIRNNKEKRNARPSPPQKERAAIPLAASVFFFPRALDKALAPPTPHKLDMAVSITKEEYTTVIAAV